MNNHNHVNLKLKGGFVSTGGALCMELLTAQGWNPAYTVEAVIMQVSNLLINGNARIPSQKKVNSCSRYNHIFDTFN